jgi:ESCRT-I complex subunit VPS28
MDALKLDQKAVDEIQPLIADLMGSLNRIHGISPDFDAKVKIKSWLQKLNQLRAMDEICEDESRQLLFDLESSYGAFMEYLSTSGKRGK